MLAYRQNVDQHATVEDARAAGALHPLTRHAIAQFIAARRDHAWIARQCDVSVAAVRGMDRALRMVRA